MNTKNGFIQFGLGHENETVIPFSWVCKSLLGLTTHLKYAMADFPSYIKSMEIPKKL